MVYKRCACSERTQASCEHSWWIQVKNRKRRIRIRGPVQNFVTLKAWTMTDGTPRATPTSRDEARDLEACVEAWALNGCDPAQLTTPPDDDGTDGPPAGTPTTIGDACDQYAGSLPKTKAGDYKDKNAASTLSRIKARCGGESVLQLLNATLIEEFLGDGVEEDEWTNGTRNRYRSRWSGVLTFTKTRFYEQLPKLVKARTPFHEGPGGIPKLAEGHRTRRLSKAEEKALIKGFAKLTDKDEAYMMLGRFYCAVDAGLRRGEMLALTSKSIKRDADGVYLEVHWTTTKNSKTRKVYVHSRRLLAFLNERRFAGFIFGTKDGKRVESFRESWEASLILAGLETGHWGERRTTEKGDAYSPWVRTTVNGDDLHWHDLRHECGSRLAAAGYPPRFIQEMLGHSDLKTCEKYQNPTDQERSSALKRITKAAGW